MADKVHCIRKTLRLMPEEAKMLAKKACDNGMNEAEYIRILKVKFHLRREWTIFIKRWSNCIRNYPINLGRKRGNTYEVVESDQY